MHGSSEVKEYDVIVVGAGPIDLVFAVLRRLLNTSSVHINPIVRKHEKLH